MRKIDRYKLKRGDDLGSPEFWNVRLEDLDLRLHAREQDGEKIDGAVESLTAVALQRLNDTFTPVVQEAISQLAQVGARFEAVSASSVEIDTGALEFVLTPETRNGWVVTDYVIVTAIDAEENGVVGKVLSYERASGIAVVEALVAVGGGTFSHWRLRVSAPPDVEHATRMDNPHGVTAAQIDAYTTSQTDAAIGGAVGALASSVSDALSGKVSTSSIVNDLTTGGTSVPLSAEQGKSLKTEVDAKIAKSANLSDIGNAATAFGNIKQAATESATGVVELATNAEATTGTDTTRAVTPAGFLAALRGNLLGTVTQSGGVPTGKVIERGANANGAYVRYADGTQICTAIRDHNVLPVNIAVGPLFRSNGVTWAFPAAFAAFEYPVVSFAFCRENVGHIGGAHFYGAVSTTSVTYALWAVASLTMSDTKRLCATAIGRWF